MRRFSAIWHFNGSAYTDVTSTVGGNGGSRTLASNDKLYLGYPDWLAGIFVNLVGSPSAPDIVPEVWDEVTQSWAALPTQETFVQLTQGHTLNPTAYGFKNDGVCYWSVTPEPILQALKRSTASFPESVSPPVQNTLYWVRLRNAGSETVTFSRLLPLLFNTYVSHQEMAHFMGLPEFDEIRDPLVTVIRDRIRSAEDWLDNYTRRTWRIRPYYNEHYDFNPYGFATKHRPLLLVQALRFWQGTSFVDMTEGRGKDWFMTPEKSMIRFTLPSFRLRYYSFLLSRYLRQPDSVEIDYIAGGDFDTHDQRGTIRDIVYMKCGADLVRQLDWTAILVNNPDAVPKAEKAKQWDLMATEKADELRAPLII